MENKRTTIKCVAPEQIPFFEKLQAKRKIKKQIKKLNIKQAGLTGTNTWLMTEMTKLIPETQIISEEVPECDYMFVVWDGDRDTDNPVFNQITAFVDKNPPENLIQIIIKADRELNTDIDTITDSVEYDYDIFLSACTADEKMAKKIMKMIKSGRAPRSVAKKVGRKRIKSVYLSVGDTCTGEDESAIKSSKILVLICSENSVLCDKNSAVTDEFSKIHGRKYIYPAVISGTSKLVFPPALLKEETYTDPRTNEEVKMTGEPLAAKFNKENWKHRKREIMRLLAPVFGCSFDDLVRRKLQQRRNRLLRFTAALIIIATGITAGIVALASYELAAGLLLQQSLDRLAAQEAEELKRLEETRLKLQEAEEANAEARFVEARSLTREAEIAFSNGDIITALNLLIAATPEQGVVRDIPKETEALFRKIMGQDEVIDLLGNIPENPHRLIQAHESAINDLHIGTGMFATASEDGTANLYDFDGNLIRTLETGSPLSSIELRENINRAVTCATEGNVILWDITTGERLWEVNIRGAGVARLSPDGSAVVVGSRADMQHYNTTTAEAFLLSGNNGNIIATFPSTGLPWYGEIFTDDVFVIQDMALSQVRYITTGNIVTGYRTQHDHDGTAAILSKGGVVFFSHHSGIEFFNFKEERITYRIFPNSPGVGARFCIPSPIDENVYLEVSSINNVMFNSLCYLGRYWDFNEPKVQYIEENSYQHPQMINSAAFSNSGVYGIITSIDGTAVVLNNSGLIWMIDGEIPLVEAGFSPGDKSIIIANESGQVRIYPFHSLETIREMARRLFD